MKKSSRVRDKQLPVRVTEEEGETFREQAEACGIDLSTWVRLSLLWCGGRAKSRPMPLDEG